MMCQRKRDLGYTRKETSEKKHQKGKKKRKGRKGNLNALFLVHPPMRNPEKK